MSAMNHKYNIIKVAVCALITLIFALYGCQGSKAPAPAPRAAKQQASPAEGGAGTPEVEPAVDETPALEGYAYDRRDRRDPFIPLIIMTKAVAKKDTIKVGTVEGYDIGEFVLSAIARMGTRYFALLTTPDNRSFTISEGDVIGLNRGKVEEISSDEVVLVEYSQDYKGELKPRKIILEFVKGE